VRERHLDQLDVAAAALYLFLVTVADARGLSWYGDKLLARRLSIDEPRLRQARADLMRNNLIAFASPLYQVLSLDAPSSLHTLAASARPVSPVLPVTPAVPQPADPAVVRGYISQMKSLLESTS
jgi:hypothetical protein